MINCLIVGLGGFIGSVCRYLIGLIPVRPDNGFPIKTLIINLTGAFIIGLITALAAKWKITDSRIMLMLKAGVCGGFTTFSTFTYESVNLYENGHAGIATAYILISVIFGILAVYTGEIIVR
jgi:CrcB protein